MILALLSLVTAIEIEPAPFKALLGKGNIFIKFYAPWCGHCKSLAPTWMELEDSLEPFKKKIMIASIDAEKYAAQLADYKVEGFPTLLFFDTSKKMEKYEGPRDLQSLLDFVQKKAGIKVRKEPSHVTELGHGKLTSLVLEPKKNALVKFYAPWCGYLLLIQSLQICGSHL
jgi:protein disulfide-isomerase A6